MANQYFYDLSGMINVEKALLDSIKNQDNSTIIKNINDVFDKYYTTDKTVNDTLTHQQNMLNIVGTENDRLKVKKDEIDTAYTGKQRAVELNDSYRLRYKQILKIILVIIITIVLFIAIIFASRAFPFVPSFIFEILSIIVVSIGIIVVYSMTINLLSRSKVDYNELNLPPPGVSGNAIATSLKKKYNEDVDELLRSLDMNICYGSSCCDLGTYWDSGNGVCAGNTYSNFTTINLSQLQGEFEFNKSVMPNSPNEFSDYTFVR
uniref:Uncharacterized protein n=1 Tax=viral metagenome TaxID=1070528 RepID=A0A6C0HT26_9ZZZZ